MTVLTETFFSGASLAERFAAFRAERAEQAAKRKIYQTTLAELESLSARELADIGVDRGMIRNIAREAAYGM